MSLTQAIMRVIDHADYSNLSAAGLADLIATAVISEPSIARLRAENARLLDACKVARETIAGHIADACLSCDSALRTIDTAIEAAEGGGGE